MKTLIQIYEIQDPTEARQMLALGVDRIGCVVTPDMAVDDAGLKAVADVVRRAGASVSVIPLTTDFARVSRVLSALGPDVVHFCDALCDDRGQALDPDGFLEMERRVRAAHPGVKIMRSVPVGRPGMAHKVDTLAVARPFYDSSDILLIDTWLGNSDKDPEQGFIGITGKACDWDVSRRLVKDAPLPVILAGGLGPDNVAQGILTVRPAGVDSCTQTNAVDAAGRPVRFSKDPDKVAAMVARAREADREANRESGTPAA